jgi:hypothetical protein
MAVLSYASAAEPTEPVWERREDGLLIRLAPPAVWALVVPAALRLGLMCVVVLPLAVVLILEIPVAAWIRLGVVAVLLVQVGSKAIGRLVRIARNARRLTVIEVREGLLRVVAPHELGSSEQSWHRTQIADVRTCLNAISKSACRIRLSIELRAGDIQDVRLRVRDGSVVVKLENDVREALGLAAPQTSHEESCTMSGR